MTVRGPDGFELTGTLKSVAQLSSYDFESAQSPGDYLFKAGLQVSIGYQHISLEGSLVPSNQPSRSEGRDTIPKIHMWTDVIHSETP